MIKQKSEQLKVILAILLAVLFVVSLTITSASAGMLDPQPEPPAPQAPPVHYKLPGWFGNPWNSGIGLITPTVDIDDPR